MIITLKGADFSTSNIGTLSTYSIRFDSNGITNTNTSVDRETNTGYTATITFKENYELNGDITVTMGGVDITSTAVSGVNITIAEVTGNVVIKVPTKSTVVEPEVPTTQYTITYKYMSGSTEIKTATTEKVNAGTTKTFSITDSRAQVSGYTCSSVSPSGQQTINSNITVTYNYTANSGALEPVTLEFTAADANYYVKISDGSHSENATWVTTPPVLLSRLADGDEGYCINPIQGHASVASIAYYSGDSGTQEDYISGIGGSNSDFIVTGERTSLTAQQIKDNAPEGAIYVTFSTHTSYGTVTLTVLQPGAGSGDGEEEQPPSGGEVTGELVTLEFNDASYYVKATDGSHEIKTDWITSTPILLSSLANDEEGYCVRNIQGHGSVAGVAYYSGNSGTSADYISGLTSSNCSEIILSTSSNLTLNTIKNSAPQNATYVTFSTHTKVKPLKVTVI